MVSSFRHQSTIATPVSVSGYGFWSGQDVTLEFRPAEENSGIEFVRSDLAGQPRIPAIIQNRVPGPRRTTLVHNGCAVEMVEHVMAALAGLQIDNCEVHVDRAEIPGMDGSSEPFVRALLTAGQVRQQAKKTTMQVITSVRVEHGEAWMQAQPVSQPHLHLTYQLDYSEEPAIGQQSYTAWIDRETFIQQIAPARTFLLAHEARQLKRQGLGNRVSNQDVLIFDSQGPLDNSLRFADECARHKTLDMIGDFALAGKDLIGNFTASRSGHLLNSKMIFALMQQFVSTQPNRQSA